MGSLFQVRLVCLVLALTIIQRIHAEIDYQVIYMDNGDAAERFKKEIGNADAISIMKEATEFVWEQVLIQFHPSERKTVRKIDLVIDIYTQGNDNCQHTNIQDDYSIHINPASIRDSPEKSLKGRITRYIYFEMGNILQWKNNDPQMTKIIAFYVVLKKGIHSSTTVPAGAGEKWNSGTAVTAQFLLYCNNRKPGFVAFVNKMMCLSSFSESFFMEYFQESVDVLWKDYKDTYYGLGGKKHDNQVRYEAPDDIVNSFKNNVGEDFAISTMKEATKFVWEELLEQVSKSERKYVKGIELLIDRQERDKLWYADIRDSEYFIHINPVLVRKSSTGRLKIRIERLIYLEVACILQWRPTEDRLMKTSIAYYTTLKKKIQSSDTLVPVKEGEDWNSNPKITAQFLEFCNKRKRGFVPFLNNKMRTSSFTESFFEEFFKEKVDVLWKAYKDEYGGDRSKHENL